MQTRTSTNYIASIALFLLFLAFTLVVKCVDVRAIGPLASEVGLSGLNGYVLSRLGQSLFWYHLTDWLGLVALAVALGFASLGLGQLLRRKSLARVDPDLIVLGFFYLAVIGCYVFFEKIIVNYRPILLGASLEPSYPSSHTFIVVSIMATAMLQFRRRVRSRALFLVLDGVAVLTIVVTVLGRIVSGVHWFTDILGGLLLSAALVMTYQTTLVRKCHHDCCSS